MHADRLAVTALRRQLLPESKEVQHIQSVESNISFVSADDDTAVKLASFPATALDGSILVELETISERDNVGFNL